MTTVKDAKGKLIDFDAAVELMDDELCEELNGYYDTDQEFLVAYASRHEVRYGEEFVPYVGGCLVMARPSLTDLDPTRVAHTQRTFERLAAAKAKRSKGRTHLSYLADAERHRALAERAERAAAAGGWEVA